MFFVTKYRYKMFKNPKTVEIIRRAINEEANKHGITIKELSFGEDYAHMHIEIDIPNTLSIAQVAQLLKGYSSYAVFKEMPRQDCDTLKGISGPQDTATALWAQETKTLCRTISGGRIWIS